ncbi:MAG TPA: helix-turn-helix domain-containing protein, partial [Candidatus Thermoplasmatota archaeon]|nr:helix-turn-helix domain-containing protein [Candidatus Thermoplasmatota archaeon]
ARHGLYTSPRATTAATIADAVGLSRSTFDEHLRKAENKLVHNLVPYLELAAKARAAGGAVATPPRT